MWVTVKTIPQCNHLNQSEEYNDVSGISRMPSLQYVVMGAITQNTFVRPPPHNS